MNGDFLAVNANKCLMTRMQEMSLNYHFKVEQESGSTRHAFFGFNGIIKSPSTIKITPAFRTKNLRTITLLTN